MLQCIFVMIIFIHFDTLYTQKHLELLDWKFSVKSTEGLMSFRSCFTIYSMPDSLMLQSNKLLYIFPLKAKWWILWIKIKIDCCFIVICTVWPSTLTLQVSAIDSDPATSPNGQITYSIVGPVEGRELFQIDPFTGNITARVSLTTASEDFYRVNLNYAFSFFLFLF